MQPHQDREYMPQSYDKNVMKPYQHDGGNQQKIEVKVVMSNTQTHVNQHQVPGMINPNEVNYPRQIGNPNSHHNNSINQDQNPDSHYRQYPSNNYNQQNPNDNNYRKPGPPPSDNNFPRQPSDNNYSRQPQNMDYYHQQNVNSQYPRSYNQGAHGSQGQNNHNFNPNNNRQYQKSDYRNDNQNFHEQNEKYYHQDFKAPQNQQPYEQQVQPNQKDYKNTNVTKPRFPEGQYHNQSNPQKHKEQTNTNPQQQNPKDMQPQRKVIHDNQQHPDKRQIGNKDHNKKKDYSDDHIKNTQSKQYDDRKPREYQNKDYNKDKGHNNKQDGYKNNDRPQTNNYNNQNPKKGYQNDRQGYNNDRNKKNNYGDKSSNDYIIHGNNERKPRDYEKDNNKNQRQSDNQKDTKPYKKEKYYDKDSNTRNHNPKGNQERFEKKKENNNNPQRRYGPKNQKAKWFDGEMIYQDPERFKWQINDFFFKTKIQDNYEEYISKEAAEEGIENHTLFRGIVSFREKNHWNCFVDCDNFPGVSLKARNESINRCFNGSEVIFRPITEKWQDHGVWLDKPIAEQEETEIFNDDDKEKSDQDKKSSRSWVTEEDDEVTDEKETKKVEEKEVKKVDNRFQSSKPRNAKEEVKVVKDKIQLKVEIVYQQRNPQKDEEFAVFLQRHSVYGQVGKYQYSDAYPHFRIDNESIKKYRGQLYKGYFGAKFIEWPTDEKFPIVQLIAYKGDFGDVNSEAECIIKNFRIPTHEYPEHVTEMLKKEFNLTEENNFQLQIDEKEKAKRLDLRNMVICTIDPETAKDLDDALSIELTDFTNEVDGKKSKVYKVGVHIADVSHFVRNGDFLDLEAAKRSVSYYFPHKVFAMLPEILCNNLCSLNPGALKYSFSIFFYMDEEGNILREEDDKMFKPHLVKSMFISSCKLSYGAAQDIIEGTTTGSENWNHEKYPIFNGTTPEQLVEKVTLLNKIAMKRRKIRENNKSVFFDFGPKKYYTMNEDRSMPTEWGFAIMKESNRLVEEYMLIGNMMVGEFMVKNFKDLSQLRNHVNMSIEKEGMSTKAFAKLMDLHLPVGEELDCSLITSTIENYPKNSDLYKKFLMFQLLKCLKPAQYLLVEQSDPETWHHMALNFDVYTHFTSPIRRYMDLIVHRLCTYFLEGKTYEEMKDIFDANIQKAGIETANNNKKISRQSQDKAEEIFFLIMNRDTPFKAKGVINFINNQEVEVFCIEMRGSVRTKWKNLQDKYKVEYKDHEDVDLRTVTLTKLNKGSKNKKEVKNDPKSEKVDEKDKKNDEEGPEQTDETKKEDDESKKEDETKKEDESKKEDEPFKITLARYDMVEIEISGSRTYPIESKVSLVF